MKIRYRVRTLVGVVFYSYPKTLAEPRPEHSVGSTPLAQMRSHPPYSATGWSICRCISLIS